MGRIRTEIEIDGRHCWTLFDSGARNSCVSRAGAEGLDRKVLPQPRQSRLGGSTHDITEVCLLVANIEGRSLEFQACVIDAIGQDEDGREIDVLFGALAIQLWGIRLDLQNERLDFSHFAHDFLEF